MQNNANNANKYTKYYLLILLGEICLDICNIPITGKMKNHSYNNHNNNHNNHNRNIKEH